MTVDEEDTRQTQNNFLDRLLSENGVGICLTDFNGAVIFQNQLVTRLCKSCLGLKRCDQPQFDPCRKAELRSASALGTYRYMNQVVGRDRYDVFVVNSGTTMIKVIYCLTEKYARDMREFASYSFTKAQAAVLDRLVQRATTGEVMREMSISEDTVRSHIKSIYRKLSSRSRRALKAIRMEKTGQMD